MPKRELVVCGSASGVAAFAAREMVRLRARDPLGPARALLLVPTSSAAHLLRGQLEDALLSLRSACVLPAITTPAALLESLSEKTEGRIRLVDPLLREALLESAFRSVAERGIVPPFTVRGSLAGRVIQFYDELMARTTEESPELALETFFGRALEELDAPDDEGALKLAAQTRFLQEALDGYRRSLAELGRVDPPQARVALRAEAFPYSHVLILGSLAVDPADVELLSNVPGVESLHLVVSESSADVPAPLSRPFGSVQVFEPATSPRPEVIVPLPEPGRRETAFVARDREESLGDVARLLKLLEDDGRLPPVGRVAIVVPRPLPYLYLAKKIFAEAGIPFQLQDSFPLAGEPYIAAVDVVLELVAAGARREAALALLRNPFFDFPGVQGRQVAAFDELTLRYRERGGFDRWRSLRKRLSRPVAQPSLPGIDGGETGEGALPAVAAIVDSETALAGLPGESPLTEKVRALRGYLERFGRSLERVFPEEAFGSRARRAKGALDEIFERLSEAASATGDPPMDFAAFRDKLRRAIEAHTFALRTGETGAQIVDARSAAYGSFDVVVLVGLNEGEWPERSDRNIFYPQWLLRDFGFPSELELLARARRTFQSILGLASKHLVLARHQLEDEIPTVASPFLEDAETFLDEGGIERRAIPFPLSEIVVSRADAARRGLLELERGFSRRERAGDVEGPLNVPEPVSPTAFELYLRCPFKYYSRYLLSLEEEEEVDEALTDLERGRILHEILQEAFLEWDGGDGQAPRPIEPESYDDALEHFRRVALRKIPPEHRAIEMARLLGSTGEPGAIAWLLRREMSHGTPRTRLVEHAFSTPLRVEEGPQGEKPWYVRIKGRVDRADVDASGYLHVIDYKSGRAPGEGVALQVPLYAMCLAQELDVPVREALYLSFRDRRAASRADFDKATELLVSSYRSIQAGLFPPRPHQEHLCASCGFLGVCRKEIEELTP